MGYNFAGKNIVLISPKFFNYEQEIKRELERKGASVYFIDDRLKDNIFTKILFRTKFSEKLLRNKIVKYFDKHLRKIKTRKIDYVLAITPEGFSKRVIEFYKRELQDAVFILYMWDSIRNRPYITEMLGLYDKVLTFDKNDSNDYAFYFRPLFYTDDYREIGLSVGKSTEFDLSFIGTAHSDRYTVVKKLVSSSSEKLKCFLFFYLQHPIMIAWHRIIEPSFRKVKIKDLSFKSLTKQQIVSVLERSACVIDVHHPRQNGLTMRTMEVLGAKRKLITTNVNILNYDFYNPANIVIIDRQAPILDEDFLKIPYQQPDEPTYSKYSISYWVDEVFANGTRN